MINALLIFKLVLKIDVLPGIIQDNRTFKLPHTVIVVQAPFNILAN